jgi:hypothetical protein
VKTPPDSEALFVFWIAAMRQLRQGEEHGLFAGYGADVMAHAQKRGKP